MQKRALTLTIERSVTAGTPDTVEVTVSPLVTTTNLVEGSTLVNFPQTQVVLLANDPTTVTFSLIPSDHDDLDESIIYRIAWRERYSGRQHTVDFTMPDADTNFADLAGLGRILMVR